MGGDEMNIILCGKSCVGKTSIQNYLCDNFRYEKVITYTTRAKRDGEEDGVDYNFVSLDTFVKKYFSGELICVTNVNGNRYGISSEYANKDNYVFVLDGIGAADFSYETTKDLLVILLTASDDIIAKRMEERSITEDKRVERNLDDAVSIEHLKYADVDTYIETVNNNGSIEEACTKILNAVGEIEKRKQEFSLLK